MPLPLQAKERELKATLNNEFRLIHEICVFVLCNTRKPDLIRTTLDTLSVYLTWVPLGYIFESNLLQILLQLFPQPAFRNVALQVGGLLKKKTQEGRVASKESPSRVSLS